MTLYHCKEWARKTWLWLTVYVVAYVDKISLRYGIKLFNVDRRYALNPMVSYPRNMNCWCGSKLKAKVCCLPGQARIVPADMAPRLGEYMKYINGRG